jgi:hypothetical protein
MDGNALLPRCGHGPLCLRLEKDMKRIHLLAVAALAAMIGLPQVAHARERSARIVGARGGQAAVTRDVTRGQRDVSRERTFRNGASRSVDRSATKTGVGEWNVNREVTGRNGETRTQTGSASVTKTDNGRSVTGALVGPNGESTFDRSVTREGGVRSVEGMATGPNGGVRTVDRTWDSNTNTMNAERILTGPEGKTRTADVTAVKDGDTVTIERTITGPNGNIRTGAGEATITH